MVYDASTKVYIGRDMGQDAYDRMPIENFGKSVLSKLGWEEGKSIGRTMNANGQSKVV